MCRLKQRINHRRWTGEGYANFYPFLQHAHSRRDTVYNINHFKYTQASITKNYDNVRLYWLDSLNVLDKNMNIRKRYLDIILNNNAYKDSVSTQ